MNVFSQLVNVLLKRLDLSVVSPQIVRDRLGHDFPRIKLGLRSQLGMETRLARYSVISFE